MHVLPTAAIVGLEFPNGLNEGIGNSVEDLFSPIARANGGSPTTTPLPKRVR